MRETVRAKLRVIVKRLLKKYGYPPDKTAMATDLILEQVESLSEKWVEDEEMNPYIMQYEENMDAILEKK
ncbi:MAG: DUF3387 domain-containing protein [DPANN group archaeon]|nr:DUF3387 domain-containing protein [DPANN group archaeon]